MVWKGFYKVTPTEGKDGKALPKETKPEPSITFKYHQGYTNAVRRNVYVKDFL